MWFKFSFAFSPGTLTSFFAFIDIAPNLRYVCYSLIDFHQFSLWYLSWCRFLSSATAPCSFFVVPSRSLVDAVFWLFILLHRQARPASLHHSGSFLEAPEFSVDKFYLCTKNVRNQSEPSLNTRSALFSSFALERHLSGLRAFFLLLSLLPDVFALTRPIFFLS